MQIGTKSLLFGAHQLIIHPVFVAIAWWKLYGFPWDPRLWFAFFLHDIGYWGKPNMDGREGSTHPALGAAIVGWLFEGNRLVLQKYPYHVSWYYFCLYHSRFLAVKDCILPSRLCFADKLAITFEPWWFYLPRVILSGEIKEYMGLTHTKYKDNKGILTTTKRIWFRSVCKYLKGWVKENNHENV